MTQDTRVTIPLADRLLVTVEEAAQLASVGFSTMRKYIHNGEIQTIKRGAVRRVVVASLKEWIAAHTQE